MAGPRPDGAREAGELHNAQKDLEEIRLIAVKIHQLVTSYRGTIEPLPQRIQQQIGGTLTGADKQIAFDFQHAQSALRGAEDALQETTQRASAAISQVNESLRSSRRR